jgi:hypothetical protein
VIRLWVARGATFLEGLCLPYDSSDLIEGRRRRDGCTIAAVFDVKKEIRIEIFPSPKDTHRMD